MLQLSVKIDNSSKTPYYIQLYEYIKREISCGAIEKNTKLPSIRQLANYLNMSRTTIETTYHQLCMEGYIVSAPKVGYYVSPIESNSFQYNKKTLGHPLPSEKDTETKAVEYDFMTEDIDRDAFSFLVWKKYINKALRESTRFLSYGSFQGEPELRKEIAKYLHQSRGVVCAPDQIIVGAGVQSLLNILAAILKPSYPTIAFEDPGFKKAHVIFKDHDYKVTPIQLGEDGINIKQLSESQAKIVYVSPSHQFPMGTTMPINSRIQLLNWAHLNESLIIEDDYDSELRYFGRPIPSLQGLNNGERVIYMGSFSKILLPSLRISYMILPENLFAKYLFQLGGYSQTSSKIEQIALSLFMKEGLFEKHIRKLRKIYAKKNQILTEAIDRIMGDRVEIAGRETGLHVLLKIKSAYDSDEIAKLAEKVGVKVIPLSHYSMKTTPTQYPLVLLSYGGIPREHIEPAIRLLQEVWFRKKA